jgi:CubicO group peptidase (beta-lactamase class C family)
MAIAVATTPCRGLAASPQDAHIARIESGLLPTVQVRGRTPEPQTLANAMALHHTPSVSIAVVDHGRILWAKAYGFADVAARTPATTRTLYQAGSISKPVTASAALQLVQEGKLGLDAPVNGELRSWRIPANSFTQGHPVTLRQVLTHTAGLTVSGFPGYPAGAPLPSVVQILDGRPPANNAPVVVDQSPGSAFRYSGGGFTVAQLLIADADGRSFPDLMRARVLLRVGMADSTYEEPLPQSRAAEAASGYLPDGKLIEGRFHVYPELAAAGLWTTPSDLARWAISLERADNGESDALMSQASARAMLAPGLGGWALGIAAAQTRDGVSFSHGGSDLGFKAFLVGWPKGERAIVVMANGEDSIEVVNSLAQAAAREYGWIGQEPKIIDETPLTAAQRGEIVGSWGHGFVVVSVESDRLIGKALGMTTELIPQGGDKFVFANGPLLETVTAVRGPDGRVKALAVGQEATFERDP